MRRRLAGLLALGLVSGAVVAAGPQAAHAAPSARPDFNCDGYADLAVGIPGETVNGVAGAGVVEVFWGSQSGLQPNATVLSIGAEGATGTAFAKDGFGSVVAFGNFDSDDCDDLAVAVPGADVNGMPDTGAVYLFFGSQTDPTGFTPSRTRLLVRGTQGIPGFNEPGARWGSALAAGDANGDFIDELAIGAPGDDLNHAFDTGSVTVLNDPGNSNTYTGTQYIEGVNGVPLPAVDGDQFGSALAFGNFTDNGIADFSAELAIGVPGYTDGGALHAGAVVVLQASEAGLSTTGAQVVTQNSPNVPGASEPGDGFGQVLAAGPLLGGDSATDLAVGAPGEDVGPVRDGGAVTVLGGGPNGLAGSGSPATQVLAISPGNLGSQPMVGDRFGSALAVAHLSGRAVDGSLVIGVPGRPVGGAAGAGIVGVVPSVNGTIVPAGRVWYAQGLPGVPDKAETGDHFGARLAVGDFRDGGADAIAVGAPLEDVGTTVDAGSVTVLYSDGSRIRPTTAGAQVLEEGVATVPGTAATGARMGYL